MMKNKCSNFGEDIFRYTS